MNLYLVIIIVMCLTILLFTINSIYAISQFKHFKTIYSISLDREPQGVASSENFIFVIYTNAIEKYTKEGRIVDTLDLNYVQHLNGGVVKDNILYCPDNPLEKRNTIHMWNINTLRYDGEIEWGIVEAENDPQITFPGSLTSVDYYRGAWWVVYAFFKDKIKQTRLVMFDIYWNEIRSWTFPDRALADIGSSSISSCSWKGDRLYCTGILDNRIFVFKAYPTTDVLTYVGTVPVCENDKLFTKLAQSLSGTECTEMSGQGISWDRHRKNVLYCINRADKEVNVVLLV